MDEQNYPQIRVDRYRSTVGRRLLAIQEIIDGPMRSPKLVDDHLMPIMQFLNSRILCQGQEGFIPDFVQDMMVTFFFAGLPAL